MEVGKEKSIEQNTSMEELKMDEDDNIKETSMEEDILGAQSLLMSESDDDNNKENSKKSSPQKKLNSKRTKRIFDSDDENEEHQLGVHNDDGVCGKQNNEISIKKQKTSVLIGSDSESDTEIKTKNRFMGLIDSESENEEESNQITEMPKKKYQKSKENKKKNQILKKSVSVKINSEVENSDSEEKNMKLHTKIKKPRRSAKENSSSETNENSSDSETSEDENKKSKQKISSLVNSDSDAKSQSGNDSEMDLDDLARAANFENNNNDSDPKGKEKKTKVMRASAKKALDEMQAIQSEQQRLHREAHISIPYHKPKKHTLQEFLKRRTIMQPQLSLQNGSPVAAVGHMRRIKMTTEEMEEYANLMDERAKEAKEFFKSESEDEEDKVFKENAGVLDKSSQQQSINSEDEEELVFKDNEGVLDNPILEINNTLQETCHLNEIEDNTSTPAINIEGEEQNNADGVQLTEAELADLLNEDQEPAAKENEIERPTCSKVLITEVIELPKLDMNTVTISPVKKHTPRPSLNIKQLLNEKNLTGSPSLSGDPNKLIDLETGDLIDKKPSGIENLMMRLMTSNKTRKAKTSETCNILSTENGKLEMTKVNVSLKENKDTNKEPKPWAAYFELKQKLKEVIKKKRLEDLHKKQEEELKYNKSLADDDAEEYEEEDSKCLANDDDEEYEEEDDEQQAEEFEPDSKSKNNVILVDDEENALEVEDYEDNRELESDDMEEANNEDENIDNNENDEDDEEEDEVVENDEKTTDIIKRKTRIIKAFDDSDEEGDRDDIDFLKTQPPTSQPVIFETQTSEKVTLEDEENELMALCSGTFETQNTAANALMSQIPLTQNNGKTVDDDELMELCSGTFETQRFTETQMKTQPIEKVDNLKPISNTIFSSEEENEFVELTGDKARVKKLTKKLTKKRAKLGFSDDEDDDEEESDIEENATDGNNIEEDLEPENEEPETFVDYDSEENEILVQMTQKDKVRQAANFFEKEAELSESEWGSADEDEKNLDKYDIELGDEDEFDREKLRTELGQIHARKMLDEDLREVRKIQEMLFEDEEIDGVGRQRTFKWKNAEAGFSLDDGPRDENADGQNGDSGDEMNEHQWRKIRYEREQFLKEQGLKPDSQDMSSTLPNTTIPSANNSTSTSMTSKKIQIITAKKTPFSSSASRKSSPFLISEGISAMHKKSVRGSFLIRDKETLNKLAGLTKGPSSSIHASDVSDTAGTVSIKSSKAKNFVFATLTEEEHENQKRKADDMLNSSNENGINFMKKAKIEPRRDKCLIDQLL